MKRAQGQLTCAMNVTRRISSPWCRGLAAMSVQSYQLWNCINYRKESAVKQALNGPKNELDDNPSCSLSQINLKRQKPPRFLMCML